MTEILIADANIFIKNLNLLVKMSMDNLVYTTQSVQLELKDKRTLENVKNFLPNLKTF